MSFKDVFERYLKEEATEEERTQVEEELERLALLNNYLMEKDAGNDSFHLELPEETVRRETRKIKKSVNKKFRRTAIVTMTALIALILCAVLVVSPVLDACFYSPYARNEYVDENNQPYPINEDRLFQDNLKALSELVAPGTSSIYAEVEKRGFSRYDIQINRYFRDNQPDIFDTSLAFGQSSTWERFQRYPSRGTRSMLEGGDWNWQKINFYTLSGRYPYDDAPSLDPHDVDFETVPDLPATAQLTGYLTFQEPLDMDALFDKMVAYNSGERRVTFQWMEVVTNEPSSRTGPPTAYSSSNLGFSYSQFWVYTLANEAAGPQYYSQGLPSQLFLEEWSGWIDVYSGDGMEHHFLGLLNQMINNPSFADAFGPGTQQFKDALSYVEQNGIRTPCVLITASRDDVLALRDDPAVDRFAIDDVTISEYSK